jgi:hypothetical protein
MSPLNEYTVGAKNFELKLNGVKDFDAVFFEFFEVVFVDGVD